MVDAVRIGRRFPEQLLPFVQSNRLDTSRTGYPRTVISLSSYAVQTTVGQWMHRITLELVAMFACPHVDLLTMKLGGKASTNLGAPPSLVAEASHNEG